MENNKNDIMTILSHNDGLAFATVRNWHRLPTGDVSALEGYGIVETMITTGSVYMMVRNMNPQSWRINHNDIKLLKITASDEIGKLDYFLMDLNASEAEQIKNTPVTLWD